MDIKVTFEDGGSAYLVHYGVKGMKWGKHKAGLQAGSIEGGGGGLLDEEVEEKTDALKKRLDAYDQVKHIPQTRLTDSNAKRLAFETFAGGPGGASKPAAELAKTVYDNTGAHAVQKAKNTLDKYNAVMEAERNLSDSEREALRKKSRERRKAQKQAARKRLESLFGIGG